MNGFEKHTPDFESYEPEIDQAEVIEPITVPDRIREQFANAVNEHLLDVQEVRLEFPEESADFRAYEALLQMTVEDIYSVYDPRVRTETLTRLRLDANYDTTTIEGQSQLRREVDAAIRRQFENNVMPDAATRTAEIIYHMAGEDQEMAGRKVLSLNDISRIAAVLPVIAPRLLEENDTFVNLVNFIALNENLDAVAYDEIIETLSDEDLMANYDIAAESIDQRGIEDIGVDSALDASALFEVMSRNQERGLINYMLENIHEENKDQYSALIYNIGLFSRDLVPVEVIQLIEEHMPDMGDNTRGSMQNLIDSIESDITEAHRVEEEMREVMQSELTQRALENPASEFDRVASLGVMFYSGLVAISNVVLAAGSGIEDREGAFQNIGYAVAFSAVASAAYDNYMGDAPGHTVGRIINNLIFDRSLREEYTDDNIVRLVRDNWLDTAPREVIASMGNPAHIEILAQTFEDARTAEDLGSDFDFLGTYRYRLSELENPEIGRSIDDYFTHNQLTPEEQEQRLYLLGFAYSRLDVNTADDPRQEFNQRILAPNNININEFPNLDTYD